jgi:hypothetical protein
MEPTTERKDPYKDHWIQTGKHLAIVVKTHNLKTTCSARPINELYGFPRLLMDIFMTKESPMNNLTITGRHYLVARYGLFRTSP